MKNLKTDQGKPRLSLVPPEMITQAARVMEYGEKKYGSTGTWRDRANTQQYIDALARHTTAFWEDPEGVDAESGLPHLSHVAANVAFLCDLMYGKSSHVPELTLLKRNRLPYETKEVTHWDLRDREGVVASIRFEAGEYAVQMNQKWSSWQGPYDTLEAACDTAYEEYFGRSHTTQQSEVPMK